jgi:choline dehydrogenase
MEHDLSLLKGATISLPREGDEPDPHLKQWRNDGGGVYSTNGAVLGIMKRSNPTLPKPDLFIFGVPLPFEGYCKGYSGVGHIHNRFTWAILKGHTRNRDGTVRLRSADPRDTPLINFHSFQERTRNGDPIPDDDEDLVALMEGVKFVRRIADIASPVVKKEVWPGAQCPPDDDRALRDFIIRETWGHHASCTCPVGCSDDPQAVLDSRFRVLGDPNKPQQRVRGLRVVDASVFPRIPGYFIVSSIYCISEKAADVITADNPIEPA